mmetsp:Transcript_124410/g.323257  ORF Transcript_124410/g.323257 Transcript_124410/m.323257 type:complete len:289 (-) Transcript_124410:18-884(-)
MAGATTASDARRDIMHPLRAVGRGVTINSVWLFQGVAPLPRELADAFDDIAVRGSLALRRQSCCNNRRLRPAIQEEFHRWAWNWLRKCKRAAVDILADAHDVHARAVVRHPMLLGIENLMANVVLTKLLQGLEDRFEVLAFVHPLETRDVLENEDPWPLCRDVVAHEEEDLAAAPLVLEALLKSCTRERLARKAGHVEVAMWRCSVVPRGDVLVHPTMRKVGLDRRPRVPIDVAAEAVGEVDAEILHGLDWCLHARAVRAHADAPGHPAVLARWRCCQDKVARMRWRL